MQCKRARVLLNMGGGGVGGVGGGGGGCRLTLEIQGGLLTSHSA